MSRGLGLSSGLLVRAQLGLRPHAVVEFHTGARVRVGVRRIALLALHYHLNFIGALIANFFVLKYSGDDEAF